MSDKELKPCPFCGSDEIVMIHKGNESTRSRRVTIKCKKCICKRETGAIRFSLEWCEEQAISAWNIRTPDLQEDNRKLRAALGHADAALDGFGDKVNYEKAFKMLLAANYMGFNIAMEDGHWWITTIEGCHFNRMAIKSNVECRSKVYDGPLQALARIDAAMEACSTGHYGLLDGVYTDNWYMGDATESNEGVTKDGKELAND